MKKNIVVIGAAGRMGRRLVALISQSEDLQLVGAIEYQQCPLIGQDSGVLSGIPTNGVLIDDSLEKVIEKADAIIDFSTADVIKHTQIAIDHHVGIVIGTTALPQDDIAQLKVFAQRGKIVLATNMSVGVNLLFHLVKEVAKRLSDDYDIEILEMHHNQKKDSPSGTATTLSERIAEGKGWNVDEVVRHGRHGIVGARTKKEIGMHAIRGGDVIGDHTVVFATNGERLELTHKASSRDTFAMGALTAVRFLCNNTNQSGFFNMQDVLGIES